MESKSKIKVRAIKKPLKETLRRDKSKKFSLSEKKMAESFKETILKERERSLGPQKEFQEESSKEKEKRMLMWIVISLIMISVFALWILGFKYNISKEKNEFKKDETIELWNEIKKNTNQFRENLNNLFYQFNLEQSNRVNQNKNLNEEELKKLTNEVLEKLKQGQVKVNRDINTNTNQEANNINVK